MAPNAPLLITFTLYLLAMVLIGLLGYRATKNLSDYILGGRSLGRVVTALSAGASDMSGWLLMGLPGTVFLSGSNEIWIAIGLICGAWLNWKFVAARLRAYTERCANALTLPEYFSRRFEDNSNLLRLVTALVILVFFTIYCASGIVAGARLFEDMFDIPYVDALWIGATATIVYVLIGGFLAVSWTDTVQASLMITALIIVPLMVIYDNGGIQNGIHYIAQIKPTALNPFYDLDGIAIISLVAWGLGYFGQPHILVRFMAAASVKTIPAARRISISWMSSCLAGTCAVGFFAIAFFAHHPELSAMVTHNPETVFIELTKHLFNPWIAGLFLAAILAAVMSTLSCQLLVCSSALTEDFYHTFLRRNASQRELVWCGRAMVLLISLIAISIAHNPESKVLKMVSYAWAGFGAAFGPVVILSLLWSRISKLGAIAGIIVGASTVLIWKQYEWFDLYEIVPGFIFSTLAIIIVSIIDAKPSASILKTFAQVKQDIQ